MVRIGIVGVGFMGMIHYLAARAVEGAKVVAICSRDPKKLQGDWRSIQGNFGPRGGIEDLRGLRTYDAIAGIAAADQVDLLDICLPNHLHRDAALAGLDAGKHVLVEKPIATTLADADAMVEAARTAGRLLMVAQVLPFFPEFAFARRLIEEGAHGPLRAAHFKRLISRPAWSADLADASKSGGPGIDLHIHDNHFIALTCGMPRAVSARGILNGGFLDYVVTQYLYDADCPVISCASGALVQPGRAFAHGYEIYLERATLLYESATLGGQAVTTMPLTLLTADGQAQQPQLQAGGPLDGFTAELQYAVDAIRNQQSPRLLSGDLGRDALRLCHCEIQSVQSGRAVDVPRSRSS